MLSVPSFTSLPTSLALPSSLAAVTVSDGVSTRVTANAVQAPLSNVQAGDNAPNATTISLAPLVEDEVASNNSIAGNSTGNLAGNISSSGDSAAFLAQLLGQDSETNNSQTLDGYTTFAPATVYNTLVGYGYIKYKPSNAGVPPQPSPLPAPVISFNIPVSANQNETAAAPANDQPVNESANNVAAAKLAAASSTTEDNQAAEITVPAVITFTPHNYQPSQSAAAQPASGQDNTSLFSSLLPPTDSPFSNVATYDFQAYSQTQSRNQTNLSFAEPQFVVAG